jgi:hypothetical protein
VRAKGTIGHVELERRSGTGFIGIAPRAMCERRGGRNLAFIHVQRGEPAEAESYRQLLAAFGSRGPRDALGPRPADRRPLPLKLEGASIHRSAIDGPGERPTEPAVRTAGFRPYDRS